MDKAWLHKDLWLTNEPKITCHIQNVVCVCYFSFITELLLTSKLTSSTCIVIGWGAGVSKAAIISSVVDWPPSGSVEPVSRLSTPKNYTQHAEETLTISSDYIHTVMQLEFRKWGLLGPWISKKGGSFHEIKYKIWLWLSP